MSGIRAGKHPNPEFTAMLKERGYDKDTMEPYPDIMAPPIMYNSLKSNSGRTIAPGHMDGAVEWQKEERKQIEASKRPTDEYAEMVRRQKEGLQGKEWYRTLMAQCAREKAELNSGTEKTLMDLLEDDRVIIYEANEIKLRKADGLQSFTIPKILLPRTSDEVLCRMIEPAEPQSLSSPLNQTYMELCASLTNRASAPQSNVSQEESCSASQSQSTPRVYSKPCPASKKPWAVKAASTSTPSAMESTKSRDKNPFSSGSKPSEAPKLQSKNTKLCPEPKNSAHKKTKASSSLKTVTEKVNRLPKAKKSDISMPCTFNQPPKEIQSARPKKTTTSTNNSNRMSASAFLTMPSLEPLNPKTMKDPISSKHCSQSRDTTIPAVSKPSRTTKFIDIAELPKDSKRRPHPSPQPYPPPSSKKHQERSAQRSQTQRHQSPSRSGKVSNMTTQSATPRRSATHSVMVSAAASQLATPIRSPTRSGKVSNVASQLAIPSRSPTRSGKVSNVASQLATPSRSPTRSGKVSNVASQLATPSRSPISSVKAANVPPPLDIVSRSPGLDTDKILKFNRNISDDDDDIELDIHAGCIDDLYENF